MRSGTLAAVDGRAARPHAVDMSNRPATAHTLVARFPGVCAVSGQRFAAGASIVRCPGGYAGPARRPAGLPVLTDMPERTPTMTTSSAGTFAGAVGRLDLTPAQSRSWDEGVRRRRAR